MTVVRHDSLVEDEIVPFFTSGQLDSLVRDVSLKEGRVLGGDGFRIALQSVLHGRFDGIEVDGFHSQDIQRDTFDFAFHFRGFGRIVFGKSSRSIGIVLGSPRYELLDHVALQLVGHLAQEVAYGYDGVSFSPLVDDRVGVVVENALIQSF